MRRSDGEIGNISRTRIANPQPLARQIDAHDPVYVERLLWSYLRDRKLGGWKFRRQVLIGPYIADYVCTQKKLVIELDGGVHVLRQERDRKRDAYIRSTGYIVLRFRNEDVLRDPPGVLAQILRAVEAAPSPWPSPPKGERVP